MDAAARVQAVFTGRPKQMQDGNGVWTSSIFRDRVEGPVAVSFAGLEGDKVTQPYHGGPGAAICVHLADHYTFWNSHLQLQLEAGAVGENITLEGICEDDVCIGDQVRLGTALVQVSGPRTPCANLARRIGRGDWVRLTIQENRTGFYLRVLEPGVVQEGDSWTLVERINPSANIPPSIAACISSSIRNLRRACWRCRGWRPGGRNRLGRGLRANGTNNDWPADELESCACFPADCAFAFARDFCRPQALTKL